ncbi:hypothetical protein [Lyngbya sp. PCC 8106]|uniref:hypothetical protein n=1 Tax=Lyngbya sp. (strain PCC 8106) TaxID=313612 RepID=UPI0000EA9C30|nr:hypothetical protein [Lyngbya sp. PCC 8106]EAW33440.1 hypothetical protein L8106_02867 [Lyngbya sp. PCC 8106]
MSKTQSKATLNLEQTFRVKEFVEIILLFSISAGMSWYLDMIQLTTTPLMVGIGLIAAGISIGYSTLETVLIGWTVLTLVSVILIASIAIFVPLTALKISAISMISLLVGGTSGSVMFWLIQRRLFLSLGRTKGIVIASLMIALGLLLPF